MMRQLLLFSILMQPLMLWGVQTIRLAADEWPPFTGQEGQHHMAQDLVAHALDRAGLRLTVSIGPWKRALAAVQDNRVDGLVAVWRTERRASVQRGELTVQELFLGGKLKMEGDYSLALQIAMQLLTNPL